MKVHRQHWVRSLQATAASLIALGCFGISSVQSQTMGISRPLVRLGSQGPEVSELQAALKLLGFFPDTVDGVFGDSTVVAVSRFQQAAGVESDGVVGPATWDRLFPTTIPATNGTTAAVPSSTPNPSAAPVQPTVVPAPVAANTPYPILRRGARGAAVLGLQSRLRAIGMLSGEVDGIFGEETEEAVRAAQSQFQLDPDGVVGPATWDAILR